MGNIIFDIMFKDRGDSHYKDTRPLSKYVTREEYDMASEKLTKSEAQLEQCIKKLQQHTGGKSRKHKKIQRPTYKKIRKKYCKSI